MIKLLFTNEMNKSGLDRYMLIISVLVVCIAQEFEYYLVESQNYWNNVVREGRRTILALGRFSEDVNECLDSGKQHIA